MKRVKEFLKIGLLVCSKIAYVIFRIESFITGLIGQSNRDAFANQILRIPFIGPCLSSLHHLYYYLARGGIIVLPHRKALALVWLPEGIRFLVPDHHSISVIISIWRKNAYDLPLDLRDQYEKLKMRGSTVLDIGAHIGIYTVKASKLVEKEGHVVAVEPYSANFDYLKKNLNLNNCENTIPMETALNSSPRQVNLFISNRSSVSHSIILRRSEEFATVQTITMDQLVQDLKLKSINLVKINAEGATIGILKGGEETLKTHKPLLFVSVGHYQEEQKESIDYLTNIGYLASTKQRLIYAWPVEIIQHQANK